MSHKEAEQMFSQRLPNDQLVALIVCDMDGGSDLKHFNSETIQNCLDAGLLSQETPGFYQITGEGISILNGHRVEIQSSKKPTERCEGCIYLRAPRKPKGADCTLRGPREDIPACGCFQPTVNCRIARVLEGILTQMSR